MQLMQHRIYFDRRAQFVKIRPTNLHFTIRGLQLAPIIHLSDPFTFHDLNPTT